MDPEKIRAWETQRALLPAEADDLSIDRMQQGTLRQGPWRTVARSGPMGAL